MTNMLLLMLLICHLLGDFYFQSSRLVRVDVARRIWHGLIYALPYCVLVMYLSCSEVFQCKTGYAGHAPFLAFLVILPIINRSGNSSNTA